MKKFYTIFFIIDLEPKYFYMWVNFVDLIFKNFNLNPEGVVKEEGYFKIFEKVLLKSSNLLNLVMLYLGIITYFIFIYI